MSPEFRGRILGSNFWVLCFPIERAPSKIHPKKFTAKDLRFATPPACYRSLSGPKCPGSVPRGVSGALRAPGSGVSKKCPQSVPRVSKTCPNTPGTLSGHSGDTFWTLRSPGPKGPQRHPEGHSRDTSGPKGPRDSCSRPGGLQI